MPATRHGSQRGHAMPASTDQLLDAVERTLFVYPEVPGLVTDIRIQGVLGRESPVSHPVANLVGCAVLDEADADATISAVRDRFSEGAKSFGWVTSPSSRPHDLPQRLLEAGLVKADELAGMALTDLETPIRANPEVEVRQASAVEQRRAIPMVGNAYGMPPDVAEWFTEALIGAEHLRCAMYHAYLPDHQGPVAFGNLVFVPRTSIVLLGGAGTLGGRRGRGGDPGRARDLGSGVRQARIPGDPAPGLLCLGAARRRNGSTRLTL